MMLWLLVALVGHAATSGPERERLLNLDFKKFDQNLPSGGWRSLDPPGAAEIIEAYLRRHAGDLRPADARLLHWHCGQNLAMLGRSAAAIAHFERAIDRDAPPNHPFRWNAYVRGTIAFLNGDTKALRACVAELELATDPGARVNLEVLKSFDRNPGATYAEAYGARAQSKD